MDLDKCIEALYRDIAPGLLATLTRLLGPHLFSYAEDIVQDTFAKAALNWRKQGLPENPKAWLYRVARNAAIDVVRRNQTQTHFTEQLSYQLNSEWTRVEWISQAFSDESVQHNMLRMMFMCCHPSIKPENRLPFVLRHLCGFSLDALAKALLLPVDTVKKRLNRTKRQIAPLAMEFSEGANQTIQLDSVHTALYLMFNEGYYTCRTHHQITINLCVEAMQLVTLLLKAPQFANQDTLSLYALMHFHTARLNSRFDGHGELIALDAQDRKSWDKNEIEKGSQVLKQAADLPRAAGRFYIEALIAQQHCLANQFQDTNWNAIASLYADLYEITLSPLTQIHQAIALGYAKRPEQGITLVQQTLEHKALQGSHIPLATLAHLHAMLGQSNTAYDFARQAERTGGAEQENRLMWHQINKLLASHTPSLAELPR